MIRNVDTEKAWSGLKRMDEYSNLMTSTAALESKIRAHPFWHNICMLAKTLPEMKKKFSTTEVEIEVRERCSALEQAASSVLDVAVCLARIQAQRENSGVVIHLE